MTVNEDSAAHQRSGVADIREDEEQARKFEEIVKLLVAAGYFRARIKALSPFDRVVGGIAWSVSFSDVDIDVDLDVLFQENATIGTKIALTEKLVRVLRLMRCPVLLEPHQLQGLDFKSIFPVVQWLVRNAVDTRQQLAEFMAKQADYQRQVEFGKNYVSAKAIETCNEADEFFPPMRRFRHGKPKHSMTEDMRVSVTLMEYGDNSFLLTKPKQDEKQEEDGGAKMENDAEIEELMGDMAAVNLKKQPGAGAAVRNAFAGAADGLRELAAARKQALEEAGRERETQLSAAKQIEVMTENITELRNKITEAKTQRDEALAVNEDPQKKRDELDAKHEELRAKAKALDELWAGENKETLEEFSTLMEERSSLERLEKESKQTWKTEHEKLASEVSEAENAVAAGKRLGGDRLADFREQVEASEQRLANARLALAKRARKVAIVIRKLDELPSRAELAQYQRRFVELFDQIAELLRQTKQLYRRYNMIDDSRLVVSRELELLNSLIVAYPRAFPVSGSVNHSAASELLRQMEAYANSVVDSKAKAERRQNTIVESLSKAESKLTSLLECQRTYSRLLGEFAAECNKQQ